MKNKTDGELEELSEIACGQHFRLRNMARQWHPLMVDAQAFELMVELKFRVEHVYAYGQRVMVGNGEYWAVVPYNGDPLAATRRAIVMAAAKLAEGRYVE